MTQNNLPTVQNLLKEITETISQSGSSKKDEIRIMRSMLSDPSYEVSIYGKDGIEGTYNPTEDFRSMCSSIMSNTAQIPLAEANQIMQDYEVKNAEAASMVNLSKEFVNTFLKTGRKLPLGPREKSDISISLKKVDETVRAYPQKIGVNDDGTDRYSKVTTVIPAHESLRVNASCPSWIK